MRNAFVGVMLALSALNAPTLAATEERYRVAFELREGGKVIAQPRLVIPPHKPALIAAAGDDAYSIEVRVEPRTISEVYLAIKFGSTATGTLSPNLVTVLGSPAFFGHGTFEVKVDVTRVASQMQAKLH